jgi:diguanylate cyclase (GGDEF)-like protein/PAS domain S-box-containing protein
MGALRKQSRRFVAEWLALGVMMLIIATVLAGALYRDRGAVEAREADRLQTQARVIDENLLLQLAGANQALLGIGAELKGADLFASAPSLLPKLKLLTDAQPGVSSMLVMDSAGTVVAATLGELTGKNFRQREYFDAPRRGADPAMLYVSPPFYTTLGNYIVVISRALTDQQGAFSGVITATLDTNYFTGLLRSVLYAPDMRTTLIHRDGKVFLSTPVERGGAHGPDPSAFEAALERHLRSGGVTTLTTSRDRPSGDERVVAMRTIERGDLHIDKAMIVAVSRSLADVYLPWWERVHRLALLLAILTIGSSTALYLHHRRRRTWGEASEAIERERRLASERVELALRGADLGLWDLHVPSGDVVVNARERALLGYADGDALPQGGEWRKLIHPDDLAHVDAAIVPHLNGEVAAYECEHRMRHTDGHDIWLSSRSMIVERAPDGAPIRFVGTHLDISERKRTEERLALASARLRDSEEELRLATDNMPALVSRLDTEQRFRFANHAYSEWLQLDPASLIGKSVAEVYGDEAYATFRPHVERALAGERVVYEREMRTPFGAKWVEVTLVPQSDHDGTVKSLYALTNDITARHEAEIRLAMSEQRLTLALECSGLALFDWNIAAGTMYHSAQAAVMRGDPPQEISAPVAELQGFLHPADMPAVLAQMKAALTGAVPVYLAEYRLRRGVDDWLWIRAHGRVVQRDAAGRALRLAGTYTDINDAKIAEGRLRRLAEFDTLTGLPNRALFNDRLRQGMARAARGKPLALLFLDIDRFKSINDTFGHEAGDKLLKVFASRMLSTVRQSDTVARLAGDEFTIILEQLGGVGDAKAVARKLVETLRQPIAIAGRMLEVTVSIGVALCSPGDDDDVALLRRADEALYEAKRRGRDGFHCDDVEATFETQAAAGSSAVH